MKKKLTKNDLKQFYIECQPMFDEQAKLEEEMNPIFEKMEKEKILHDKKETFGKLWH